MAGEIRSGRKLMLSRSCGVGDMPIRRDGRTGGNGGTVGSLLNVTELTTLENAHGD